ncbi:MAG: ABC transporter [Alphaproteobacteria bacterium]|nr:MAG: ABC transporter [Caulobacteraceae bacterium]TPW04417.1 MAG: ABC transporter [Alphaproteobacteria bacterium]
MSARRFALIVFAALAVIFLAGNIVVSNWFSSARLDLTENQIYSISKGTRRTLADLNEPITLTFFYSRDAAAAYPQVRTYGARVRELLQTYSRRSNGKVRILEVDPVRFTEAEDQAVAAGIEPLNPEQGADPIYLGIMGANAVDEKVSIPQLAWDREPFLEYELTRLIAELQNADRKRVALITSLPWEPEMASQEAGGGQPYIVGELARMADVEKLQPDFTGIDPDTDLLAIVHPWALSEQQLYVIDQFLMTKGRAFIALDPAAVMAAQAPGPFGMPADPSTSMSSLPMFLQKWGVAMSAEAVIDRAHALPIQTMGPAGQPVVMPQPLFFEIPADQMNREDLVTAGLTRGMNVGAPGALTWTPTPGIAVTPLARTSGETMRIPGEIALSRPAPDMLLQQYVPASRQETVALRLSGKLASAFGAARPATVVAAPDSVHVAASTGEAAIILVSDVDFLDDNFYLEGRARQPLLDNAAFVLNAVDQLGGSDALVSLRSRAPSLRRMKVVEDIRNNAQARMVETQEQLQSELAETEQSLRTLEAKGQGSGFFSGNLGAELTGEERAQIEKFRAKALEVRKQLRAVERGYRTELDRLEGWLVLLNVWLAPLLVAAAGVYMMIRRQRRTTDAKLADMMKAESGKTGGAA